MIRLLKEDLLGILLDNLPFPHWNDPYSLPRKHMDKHELKKHICACFAPLQPQKILLFGSWARSQQDSCSDVDIIVVYETQKRFKEGEVIYEHVAQGSPAMAGPSRG